jgi:hypothetical protein
LLVPVILAALALGSAGGCKTKESTICRQGCGCKDNGRCFEKNRRCVVGSDADCKASRGCELMALCTARDDACVVASDEDCKQSAFCKQSGLCTFKTQDGHGRCVR